MSDILGGLAPCRTTSAACNAGRFGGVASVRTILPFMQAVHLEAGASAAHSVVVCEPRLDSSGGMRVPP